MLKKPYKIITQENGELKIYGNGHNIEIDYKVPEWNKSDDSADDLDEVESCFMYKGNRYFLSEFLRIERNAPAWMKEFDGYRSDSYFSGILLKLDDRGESVKAYTYIG